MDNEETIEAGFAEPSLPDFEQGTEEVQPQRLAMSLTTDDFGDIMLGFSDGEASVYEILTLLNMAIFKIQNQYMVQIMQAKEAYARSQPQLIVPQGGLTL